MKSYDYQKELRTAWQWAVTQYEKGNHDPETWYNQDERAFLESIGLKPNELFDFAEDYVNYGEPDFTTFALVHDIRRSYFRDVQEGRASKNKIDPEALPSRDAEAGGLPWLPRIIEKARAKLRGELHPDIMFSCGGDRNFLKTHDLSAADFLRTVWSAENTEEGDQVIVDFVKDASKAE